MTTMKYILTTLVLLLPLASLAGGGGGGGVMSAQLLSNSTEIVYHLGEYNGLVKFAYGKLVDDQWQVEELKVAKAKLSQAAMQALLESKQLNDWSELK